jgi:uncharacterized membrane protein YfcA
VFFEQFLPYLPDLALLIGAGVVAGFVAGLLGVGGGTVTVPVLYYWFLHMKASEDAAMHAAVATSLATIIATSLSSSRAHEKRGSVDQDLVKSWGPYIAGGAVVGVCLATYMDGESLRGFFSVFLLCVGLYMFFVPNNKLQGDGFPPIFWQRAISVLIGTISSLAGIGGGSMSVPFMSFCNVPMQRAIGTSSALGTIIALPGTFSFIISGWGAEGLPPFSLGYVNLLGLAVLLPTTALLAPVGAKAAHSIDKKLLRRIFGVFLAFVAAKMGWGLITH